MSLPADRSPNVAAVNARRAAASHAGANARTAWLMLRDPAESAAIRAALEADGWQVRLETHTLGGAVALLFGGAPPDLIVMGLRFGDGDGMQFIRMLARRNVRTAVFVASRQQRAVIRAALALADTLRLRVAGSSENPADPAAVASALRGFVPSIAREPAPPAEPMARDGLIELLDRGALHPWMQPKMRLSSREVVGFEALIRAYDPSGRLVYPDRLIGALAAHGLLDQATIFLARQTVGFVADCLADGIAVSASINVSMSSLSNLEFCHELERTVTQAQLDPGWITIEVTETDAMSDLATAIENAARIRMLGFNLSIDDFGTAYASLVQLSRIPFSELKIERAFVGGLEQDAGKQAIVRACAQLGNSLGLHVVAEGVETLGELSAVRQLGCSVVQGYLIGKPMPISAAREWVAGLPDQTIRF